MNRVNLAVNGRRVSADVEPRTHLADFLREHLLLTGTHLGCEQGVCGACTVLVDDAPVRSCLTFAALCDGADIRTIEALSDDPIGVALRQAFAAEHALQCGYCTPGMLVTARDIIRRLPDADEDRIRLELAGNLCRCTGYNGIVRAIGRVLAADVAEPVAAREPVPVMTVATAPSPPSVATPRQIGLQPVVRIPQPVEAVWAAIQNPALVAACIPGARVTAIDGDRVTGEIVASLGPISARFTGEARLFFDPATRTGHVAGEGRDARGGTRLTGRADFVLEPDGPAASILRLTIAYDLRGPLAQFSRGPVVAVFAAEIAAQVGRNLDTSLRGSAPAQPIGGLALMLRVLWRSFQQWMKGSNG
jgi:carbon-monoxide dehydrogenase small subunit